MLFFSLQPLNPVKNEGPAIHQCRGIQPGQLLKPYKRLFGNPCWLV